MKETVIRPIYDSAYAWPIPRAARLERLSRKGNVKQAWDIYTTPGQYRDNAEMRHTVKRHRLPGVVYQWADMVNAIITPAGGNLYQVDTPESLDTLSRAELVELATDDMVEIGKVFAARGESLPFCGC